MPVATQRPLRPAFPSGRQSMGMHGGSRIHRNFMASAQDAAEVLQDAGFHRSSILPNNIIVTC
jgi:hypothetical protein